MEKKFLIILTSFVFGFQNCWCQNNFNINGVLEPTEEQLKEWAILEPPELVAGINTKRRKPEHDLSKLNLFPIAGNQGDFLGSCTAWSLCYALKTYQEAIDYRYKLYDSTGNIDTEKVFSPAFLFSITIKEKNDCENGVYLKTALDKLKEFGTVPISSMPYRDNVDSCFSRPSPELLKKAEKNRILEYYTLRDRNSSMFKKVNIEQVKQQIFNGKPVVFAIHVDDKWEPKGFLENYQDTTEYIWKNFSSKAGNHAMLCIGYDDKKGAFKALNSFGEDWVNDGYIWIDYDIFKKKVTEAYIVEDLSNYFRDLYDSFARQENPNRVFSITSSADQLVANGKIQEGKYVEIDDYLLFFQGLSEDKKSAIYQFASASEGDNTFASIELEIGGESKSFYYKEKLFDIKAEKLVKSLLANNNKTIIELKVIE